MILHSRLLHGPLLIKEDLLSTEDWSSFLEPYLAVRSSPHPTLRDTFACLWQHPW
jgi:hypothetical protein